MAALPPMLLLTPDSLWASVKRFFARSPSWRTGGILTAAVVGTGIYYSGFVAIVQWENETNAVSKPGASAAPMTIEIEKDDVSNPVRRPRQTEAALQQSAKKGNANGQARSADTTKVTQQRKASTDNPTRPKMTLSHSPADSVVTIRYTIPDSAFKDSVPRGTQSLQYVWNAGCIACRRHPKRGKSYISTRKTATVGRRLFCRSHLKPV